MKNNEELQQDVQNAIKWEPQLNAAEIGVTVKDGVVTLTGVVDNYTKKSEAEEAAKNVAGVKAVVEKIEVRFANIFSRKNDNEIANEVLNAYKWNLQVPDQKVKVKVEDGWITLTGEVEYNYQRSGAYDAVKNLLGVTGVSNNIQIKSTITENIEKAAITSALHRNWSINTNDVNVTVSGHEATLSGTVHSLYQREEAGRTAFNAPGVWSVNNKLIVDYEYALMDV